MSLKLHFQSFSTERDGQETGGRGVMGVLVFPTYKSRQFPLGFIPNQPFSQYRCTITLSVILKYIIREIVFMQLACECVIMLENSFCRFKKNFLCLFLKTNKKWSKTVGYIEYRYFNSSSITRFFLCKSAKYKILWKLNKIYVNLINWISSLL